MNFLNPSVQVTINIVLMNAITSPQLTVLHSSPLECNPVDALPPPEGEH